MTSRTGAEISEPVALPNAVEAGLRQAADLIRGLPSTASILLACHVNPDGDALGSMLAVALGLRKLGFAEVTATFPEPFELPENLTFTPGVHLLTRAAAAPRLADLAISFDASSRDRLGELEPALASARFGWIVLDHHASNTGFGSLPIVEPGAAATVVLAARLLDQIGVEFDPQIATCLYLGLVTDTGSFRHNTTTAEVFGLAARLVAAGARPDLVAERIFQSSSLPVLKLLAVVLSRCELDASAAGGLGLLYAYVSQEDLDREGLSPHVVEGFMDVIRTAVEADACCLAKPSGPGVWSVSLRSRGGCDVGALAVSLGGGGHRRAAGFTAYGEIGAVFAELRLRLGGHDAAALTG